MYNTQGVTGGDPRNLGGSEGYGNSSPKPSGGLGSQPTSASSTSNDEVDDKSIFETIASLFSNSGATLPPEAPNSPNRFRDTSGDSIYTAPAFTGSNNTSQDNSTSTAVDDALNEALGIVELPEIYLGQMGPEEPEPNINMDVLQGALQPEPITVEEIDVKAGDTLSAIALSKGVPLQDVIDANPQIGNPDLIRPGEKVTIPSILSDAGKLFMAATDPQAPAPVSEDPDRQFYQSGVDIEDRVFEGEDPRKLGGAEGYGSVGTPPAADADAGLMTRPKARPDNAPVVTSNRTPVKVAVDTTTTSSNVKKIQQALTTMGFKPNGVDGAIGGGTARALRKFQAANDLPITGKLTQEVADLLTNGTSITYPDRPVPFAVPEDIEDNLFDIFKVEVGYIESKNKYNIKGGSGNHYDGRYQMGEAAKKDAGRALGISLKHDAASRKAFREDSALQDKAFKAYTEMNHTHLTRNSEKYRNMSVEEKLGILGYAHNQGATAAEEYLFTGIVGTDANDTKGTRYTDAIAKALGN